MDHITREDIADLIEGGAPPCVSIYLPMERRGPETRQNPLVLKVAIGEVHSLLLDAGMRRPDADAYLEPAARLVEDSDFWQHQEDGLAVLMDRRGLRSFRLPTSFERRIAVTDRFQIKPLLPILSTDGEFYVLALSHNEVRLLRGSRWRVSELELTDVPTSLKDALWYRDPETALQGHATSAGATTLAFHGHGMGKESSDEELRAFFRQVDDGIGSIITGNAPVVLSGVGYLLPLYRDVTDLKIAEGGVEGNPEELSAQELHDEAWPLVADLFDERRRLAQDRFESSAPDGTAWKVTDAVTAAAEGRVETLFVPADQERWGTFDPSTLEVHVDGDEHSDDLYDVAAAVTLGHGGDVFVVDSGEIPGSGEVAAVLRF
jgi:hypothetical protein